MKRLLLVFLLIGTSAWGTSRSFEWRVAFQTVKFDSITVDRYVNWDSSGHNKILPLTSDSTLFDSVFTFDDADHNRLLFFAWPTGLGANYVRKWDMTFPAAVVFNGADTITVVAYDGTSAVQGVWISIKNMTGTAIRTGATGSGGYKDFYGLGTGDSLLISATSTGSFQVTDIDTVVTSNWLVDTITGTSFTASAPAASSLCEVYGDLRGIEGDTAKYATLIFTLPEGIYDSCNSTILAGKSRTVPVNSKGHFSIKLLKSSCMNKPTTEYNVIAKMRDGSTRKHKFGIPSDSSTYFLVF